MLAIALTNLAANWSDEDGDPVSLVSVSVSTNGVTLTNSAGYLTYFNPANGNDQFTATITDGFGGTNYETVKLRAVFPFINGFSANPDGTLSLTLTGAPGVTYVLESAPSLQPPVWVPVFTNTLDGTGVWNFNTGPTTNAVQTFYRLQLQPPF
jgi:Cadherin-like domain